MTGTTSAPPSNPVDAERQVSAAIRQTISYAQMVSILSRSPAHRHFSLGDLEWMIVPPLLAGQFAIAEAKPSPESPALPMALVLWAIVSPAVDERLSNDLTKPIRLTPDEWQSGTIPWVVDAAGDPRILPSFIHQATEATFKGREVKIRLLDDDGKPFTSNSLNLRMPVKSA